MSANAGAPPKGTPEPTRSAEHILLMGPVREAYDWLLSVGLKHEAQRFAREGEL